MVCSFPCLSHGEDLFCVPPFPHGLVLHYNPGVAGCGSSSSGQRPHQSGQGCAFRGGKGSVSPEWISGKVVDFARSKLWQDQLFVPLVSLISSAQNKKWLQLLAELLLKKTKLWLFATEIIHSETNSGSFMFLCSCNSHASVCSGK